jgi:uncharacterized protein DUF6933
LFTIRCTRKLIKSLHARSPAEGIHSTTGLGDWYANLLFTKRLRLIICVSERSPLPVFLEAKDRFSFATRFQEQVRSVLECVGVPSYAVERETHEMTQVVLGVTVSRSVLGSLNDLALLSRFAIEGHSHIDLTSLAIEIADTPCSPIKYQSPRSMTLALLRDRCKDV